MTELRSPGSRIVLVGTQMCANAVAAPPVPAVESTMEDLAHVLRNRCGVRSEQIIRILDSADPMRMGLAVAEAADQATDVLLVHYVGHGFVSADGELYLATKATDPDANRLEHSSVPFTTIRRSLLKSRARAIVVVLDCCFSGRAIGTLSSQDPIDLADVHGGYILTSAARDQVALAPPGAPHTAFTGELIRLLDRGDPTGPVMLSMRDVYRGLDRELHRRGLPRPRQRGSERIEDLILAPNAARISAPALIPESGPTIARSRARRVGVLAAVTAVVVAAVAVPMLLSQTPSDQPAQQNRPVPVTSPNPSPVPGRSEPVAPPVDDPACERLRNESSCELPAHATAKSADGIFVTVVQNESRVDRYRWETGESLGKPEDIGGNVSGVPVIVPAGDGKLAAFAVGVDGTVQYNLSAGGEVRNTRASWRALPGSYKAEGRPMAAQDGEGKLEVFFRGEGNELWHISQCDECPGGWRAAVPMRNAKGGIAYIAGDPKVHIDRNGCLRVFALKSDTKILRTWAQKGVGMDDWPEHADEPFGTTSLVSAPTVVMDGSQVLHLFAVDEFGSLWQSVERAEAPNTWLGTWDSVPGLDKIYTGFPVAATDGEGQVFVFVREKESPSIVRYAPSGGSVEPEVLRQNMDGLWSVTLDKNGRLVVLGTHNDVPVSATL